MKIDFHSHSSFSMDSQAPMEDMVKVALDKGITHLAFTDHIDYDYDEDGTTKDWDFDLDLYFKTIGELKAKYHSKIKLHAGVELGVQPHLGERCNTLIKQYPFDFIIASLHTVDYKDLYNQKYFKTRTNAQALREYYDAYYKSVIQLDDFNVLGHLDLYLRYWEPLKAEPIRPYFDQIEMIFKHLIQNEKGIEVNSGGYFKYNLMSNNPSDEILKFYKSLKGEVITLGSDAHTPEHIGTLHDENLQLLDAIGFKYVCTFENMIPKYHSIKSLLY